MRKILGISLISSPLFILFGVFTYLIGLTATIKVFSMSIGIVVFTITVFHYGLELMKEKER